MKEYVSRVRHRVMGQRQRRSFRSARRVPFKDGTVLATLYAVLLLLFVVATLALVRSEDPTSPSGTLHLVGDLFLSAFAILGTRALVGLLAPDALARNSRICLLALVCLLTVATTAGVAVLLRPEGPWASWSLLAPHLFPYVLAPALATLLLDAPAGFALGLGTSMLMALIAPAESALPTLGQAVFAAILTPLLVHRRVRRRPQLLRACLTVALLLAVAVYIHTVTRPAAVVLDVGNAAPYSLSPAFLRFAATLASGFGCALFAAVVLPLLEHVFGAASNIALNSFADLSHPLLMRLANEAPGTYSHSIAMATLSAAAAERIGANPLLARVGAYYHDIGKLGSPNLFIENSTPEQNPHRTLKPSTSASWVRSHVKDGVVLAEKHRLPPSIKAILWEHHGTTAMAVFLHKAREQAKAEEEKQGPNARRVIVEESQFRYPGPRPTSRESAIIMLADSIEAAARTLEKPSRSALDHLVNGIVEAKLKDGQLDDCPLSLHELALVKRSFVSSLATILHPRIPYPTPPDDETNNPSESREPPEPARPEPRPVP